MKPLDIGDYVQIIENPNKGFKRIADSHEIGDCYRITGVRELNTPSLSDDYMFYTLENSPTGYIREQLRLIQSYDEYNNEILLNLKKSKYFDIVKKQIKDLEI